MKTARVWWLIGGAALLGLAVAGVVLGVPGTSQTGEDVEALPPAKQTGLALTRPTPTPIPPLGPGCPTDPVVCDVGLRIASALASGDVNEIRNLTGTVSVSCSKSADVQRALSPACDGQAEGAVADGVAVFIKSASLVKPEAYGVRLAAVAQTYTAAARQPIMNLGCPEVGARGCDRYFAVAFAPPEGMDGALVFILERRPGGAAIVGMQIGTSELGAQQGGWSNTVHPGTAFPRRMWFIPWKAG